MALASLIDPYNRGPGNEEKMKISCVAIVAMLQSWPGNKSLLIAGFIYLAQDNMKCISSLVNALLLPSDETRKIMLVL